MELKHSTWDGYRRNVDLHVLPTLGRVPIRRLRVSHLEDLYESKLRPTDGTRAPAPKTVLAIHLIHEESNLSTRPGVSRAKTCNARRRIDIDPTTVALLVAWRDWQQAELSSVGMQHPQWMFTDASGEPVHPHSISQTFERIVRRADVPPMRFHDYADARVMPMSA